MTIIDAIKQILEEEEVGLTSKEIYEKILVNNLYSFGAKDSRDIVDELIQKHCLGVDFPNASSVKHFKVSKQVGHVNYYLLSKSDNKNMPVQVRILKALQGDCIWIRYGEERFTNIVIDSGPRDFKNTFKELIHEIEGMGENIDLLIFTHIDNDHIGGANEVLGDEEINSDCIKKIWINTPTAIKNYFNLKETPNDSDELSISKINQEYTPQVANNLIDIIIRKKIELEQLIMVSDENIYIDNAEVKILSPTKNDLIRLLNNWSKYGINTPFSSESYNEIAIDNINQEDKFVNDSNPYNGSSIAFLFKYKEILLLFLGDAYANRVAKVLKEDYKNKKIDVDLTKLSHHGSASNTNDNLLSMLNCCNYVFSTNGSDSNPDKRTIARLIKANEDKIINLYSNYNWWENKNYFTNEDRIKYISTKIIRRIELSSDMIEIKEGLLIGNGLH